MGKIIYTGGKCKNPKRKPGWRQEALQEAEWLKTVQSQQLFSSPGRKYMGKVQIGVKTNPVKDGTVPIADPKIGKSLGGFAKFSGGKPVLRPEIQYRDSPEMLARELKAREKKFATAPAYNKGAPQYVSDEMMKDITAGRTRRR